MSAPKGHPYGANIRCDVAGAAWPKNAESPAQAAEAEFHRPPSWLDEQEAKAREVPAGPPIDWDAPASAPASSVGLVADGSSGDSELEFRIAAEMAKLFVLFKDRQRKYGPANIAAFGDLGVAVRASDKLARLRHHYFGGGAGDMADESVDDAWSDLAVYAVIALVCRHGGWPGWKEAEK